MEQSAQKRNRSILSVESSRKSNLSGRLSLQKLSWNGREPSLENRTSLICAMSIESSNSRQSDIFKRLLDSQKNKPQEFRSSANPNSIRNTSAIENYNNQFGDYQKIQNQGMNGDRSIAHMCQCYGDDCDREKCPCYENPNQLCIRGNCCVQCIKIKNSMFQSTISITNYNYGSLQFHSNYPQGTNNGQYSTCTCKNTKCLKSYCSCFQNLGYCNENCKCEQCENMEDSIVRQHALQQMRNAMKNHTEIFCTCKKTKCSKKYCSCYANGIKCGKICSCEGCLNCDQQPQNQQMDIQDGVYVQDHHGEMPKEIVFEPVIFPRY